MSRKRIKPAHPLQEVFPPSEPCSCEVCRGFCQRPGWWTVQEAQSAIGAGLAERMMLELAPERSFGVLSPAFRGCEGLYAIEELRLGGCTFQQDGLCALHGTGNMPLECRFCHHARPGQGEVCHAALEQDWNTPAGQALVVHWQRITGFWKRSTNQAMRNLFINRRHIGGQ